MLEPRWERQWRWTLRLGRPLLRVGFRFGRAVPELPEGRLVIAANHFSFIDPPIVGMALKRPMRFLGVVDLWEHPRPFVRLIEGYGTVPLRNTGRPVQALRTARDHLLADGTVGIFPEGRRVERWGEEQARRGAAWLAVKTGAPLLPVFLHGTDGTLSLRRPGFRLVRVELTVGDPIDPVPFGTGRPAVDALADAWQRAMDDLAGRRSLG